MVLGRRWILRRPVVNSGPMTTDNFELISEELGPLQDGDVLYSSEFISVDPYHRRMAESLNVGDTMWGSCVAIIEDSKHPQFPRGSRVVILDGYKEKGIINVDRALATMTPTTPGPKIYLAPSISPKLSPSLLLGTCGMPGNTAYFGLTDILQAKPGDTVVVTSAAGCVGSTFGQLAKMMGCTVIGFAGSAKKVELLLQLGFDSAFNYRDCELKACLEMAAPNGVDCFFDAVGNQFSREMLEHMNRYGRVAVVGAIDLYEDSHKSYLAPNSLINRMELRQEGYLVGRFNARWMEGIQRLLQFVENGSIRAEETIVSGFENVPQALLGLFKGTNVGKMVVKV